VTGHEARIQAARVWQRGPDFDRFRKERQVVEHRIARLVQLGVRQARYVGRAKTLFQVRLAATVANLTLVADLQGRRKTRTSRQARPARLQTALLAPLGALLTRLSPAAWRSKPITIALLRRQPALIPALESAVFRPRS
jgi:hypothetical protein